MIWVLFALMAALFASFKDAISKGALKNNDEYAVAWAWWFFAAPFLIVAILLAGMPQIKKGFVEALIVSGTLNTLATILYIKAINISDLSITIPMINFTPVFLLATSPLIIGEFPKPLGIVGILLILTGTYTLNITKKGEGLIAPIKALTKDKGARIMLSVAFIWSITSNFDKMGVVSSSPLFWAASITTFLAVSLSLILILRSITHKEEKMKLSSTLSAKNLPILASTGVLLSLAVFSHMTAISMTVVAYVIAIKRTSTALSTLWGYLFFKERNIRERLSGAVIMIIGVVIISLS